MIRFQIHVYIALTCLLVLAGCSSKSGEGDSGETQAPTPVEVATARLGSVHRTSTAEAVLYPLRQANIVPKISAPVQKFYVQRGDHVHEGELLAVLESRDLQAAAQESKDLYAQAKANFTALQQATVPEDMAKSQADLEASRQALEAARGVYQSRQKLYREGALARKLVDDAAVVLAQAQSQFDSAAAHLRGLEKYGREAQVQSAEAQVNAAKAHYESAEAQLSYAEVRSPLAGVVADRPVNLGDMASAGSALFTIVDISHVVARANVPLNDASAMRVGEPAIISGAEGELAGKVSVVSPAVDPNTTTLQVWVDAPNPGERLKLGTTVRISVDLGEIKNAVIVPVAALLATEEGGEKVMIAGSDGLAHESEIKTGIRQGDDVQILSGVTPGQQVIIQGGLGLDDKARVQILKLGQSEAAAGDGDDKK